ncbi:MAG: permease [Bosea sp. (in: a-proteobacteria)]
MDKSPRRLFDWSFWLIAGLTTLSLAIVWQRDGTEIVRNIFIDDIWLLGEILPKVIAGTLIGELIRRLVPREVIVRWLGEGSGLRGLMIAAFIGFLFPAGPFTVFPLAAALLVIGADRGAAVAFVTGWLLIGLNRAVIWELPFFGADIVGLRMLVSCWMPVAAGLVARWLPVSMSGTRPGT